MKAPKLARAGYTTDGPPARLNLARTMRNSLAAASRCAGRADAEIEQLEAELAAAEAETPRDDAKIAALRARLEHKQRLRRTIAYIDPIDLQYNRFERVPKPTTQAVMFCLMDASASMTEPLKDLAKRFFMLLHVFLTRYYREVDIVFIRHTSTAAEVDEETFFRGTETGGTVISTALEEMLKVVRERYSPADWNIYAAQASDGDNFHDDMPRCLELLDERDPAALPVLRLHRDRRTASASTTRVETPGLARLCRGRPAAPELRHAARGVAGGHLPGLPRAVLGERRQRPEEAHDRDHRQEAAQAQGSLRPLFDGPEWNFELIRKVYDAIGEIALGELGPRHLSQPDRGHHRRADARRLFLDRHAADVPALVVRQALRPRRGLLQARHAQPRLRARHQLRPLHQLHHGREFHDDAGAGAWRTPPWATTTSSRTTTCSSMWTEAGPHPRLPGLRQDLCRRVRGALRPRGGRERARCRARADEPGRQPLPAPAPAQRRQARAGDAPRAAASTRRRPTTISGARCPRSRAKAAAEPSEAQSEQRRLGLPEENLLYFLEKNAPKLEDWQRELLRIVRLLSQYFYPQRQTK